MSNKSWKEIILEFFLSTIIILMDLDSEKIILSWTTIKDIGKNWWYILDLTYIWL